MPLWRFPRFSRGTAGASDSALSGNLAILRTAIDTYYYEHNSAWPTQTNFVDQLTTYSSIAGAVNTSRTATYKFGPYLAAIPPCPVGDQTTPTAVAFYTSGAFPDPKVTADTGGWMYNTTTGEIIANTNVTDQARNGLLQVLGRPPPRSRPGDTHPRRRTIRPEC